MAEEELLPATLIQFLSAYPHPAFALKASSLHDSLIGRREAASTTIEQSNDVANQGYNQHESTTTSKDGSSDGQGASVAERILSSAFNAHPSAFPDAEEEQGDRRVARATDAGAAITGPGDDGEFHPQGSTLLEGGSQKDHDPSRTAEGAVRAFREQHAAEGRRREQVKVNVAQARKEEDHASTSGWGGRERGRGEREDRGLGRSLADLLKPVWANSRWHDLVAKKAGEDAEGLSLLSFLNRQDFQKFLALVVDAVEPLSKGGLRAGVAEKDQFERSLTNMVTFKFPRNSRHWKARPQSQDSQNPLKPRSQVADPNVYNMQESQGSSASSTTSSVNSSEKYHSDITLDIVVTLLADVDLLIFTTTLKRANLTTEVDSNARPPFSSFPSSFRQDSSDHGLSLEKSDLLSLGPTHQPSFAGSSDTLRPSPLPSLPSWSSSNSDQTVMSPSPINGEHTFSRISAPVPPSALGHDPTLANDSREIPFSGPSFATSAGLPTSFPDGYAIEKIRGPSSGRKRGKGKGKGAGGLEEIEEPSGIGGDRERTAEEDREQGKVERRRRRERDSGGGEEEEEEEEGTEATPAAMKLSGQVPAPALAQDEMAVESVGSMQGKIIRDMFVREDVVSPPSPPILLSASSQSPAPTREGSPMGSNSLSPSPTPHLAQSLTITPSPSPLSHALSSTSGSQFISTSNPFLESLGATEMGRIISSYAWELTPLGPLLEWPRELKVMVSFMLANPFRCSLWWGPDHVILYNDEYAKLAGSKHPALLGKSGADGWSEIWDEVGPLAARVMQGETVSAVDHHLPMLRHGFLEETWQTWSWTPFRGADGSVLGYENTSIETTARVIAERRLGVLRDMVLLTARSRTVEQYCQQTIEALTGNAYDLPFVMLYTCEVVATGNTAGETNLSQKTPSRTGTADSNAASTVKCTRQGTIGVPDGHPSAPESVFFKIDHSASTFSHGSDASSTTSNTGSNTTKSNTEANSKHSTTKKSTKSSNKAPTQWPFREAFSRRRPVYVSDLAGRADGFTPRGWPDAPINAVCIPILVEDDTVSHPRAILVCGLNPRRPWNEIYATFLHLLTRQMATGLWSVASAEQDARRAEELLALDRAKTSFFSSVSHELRTPLTLILGPLGDVLTAKENLQPADRQRLLTVQRHANRLLNMVNTLLDFSRIQDGREELVFRPTLLSTATADLASLFRSAIERGGIQFIVDAEPDPAEGKPVFLSMDLWEKILFNLLGNAFKYTMKGSITVRIRFTRSSAILDVIDTGCGIEEKELSLIFNRFHRVEATSRTIEGTGIGLSLTLQLVTTLGGQLTVQSEFGIGSTFTVTLPRGSSHLPPSQVQMKAAEGLELPARATRDLSIIEEAATWKVDSDEGSSRASVSSPSASISNHSEDHFFQSADLLNLKNSTVLLADDNDDLRRYIAGVLSKAFHVIQARNGQEALDLCRKSLPHLVISDAMMPKLDGMGLLAALRNDPSTALLPVIFLSAQAHPDARVQALTAGADDFIVKPFQSKELLARVNVHLQLGKMRVELEKRVEDRTRSLIESEMRYRGLADRYSTLSLLSPVGVFICNSSGDMTYANPRFWEISGLPPDSSLLEWQLGVMKEDQESVGKTWTETINRGTTAVPESVVPTMEFRFARNSNWVQLEVRSFNESRARRGFVGSITDITHQKKVEALHIEAVEQRARDAEETRRQQENYIDTISHELRNPLSGIWQSAELVSGSLERLIDFIKEVQDGNIPKADLVKELLDEMNENTEAMEAIILCASHQGRIADDILNVSKLNMNLLSITPVPFDVAAKMAEVIKMFEVECAQKRIALSLAVSPSLAAMGAECVVADPSRLAQITVNFLTNSIKYTSDSQVRNITIHLDAFEKAPPPSANGVRVAGPETPSETPEGAVWLVIGVQDSGKGLTSQDLKKLFARFSQANPKTDQYGGSGLGLYVSKMLVELHRGYVEVVSIPGEGSVFRCAIPALRATLPVNGEQEAMMGPSKPLALPMNRTSKRPLSSGGLSRTPPLSSPASTAPPPSTTHAAKPISPIDPSEPLHVFVVEDNLINQKVLTRQLKNQGYIVSVASDGREALDTLIAEQDKEPNPHPISVILCDVEMPVLGGIEAVRELRGMEKTGIIKKRYPVCAVTGNARQAQIDACLAAGYDDCAIKPYNFKSLVGIIERLVGRTKDI